MTSAAGKSSHPQVNLLRSLLKAEGRYAEIGCGGGEVCGLVGQSARVCGLDASPLALARAGTCCVPVQDRVQFICALAEALPLPDNSFEGTYAFEVLEHVWDASQMVREMVRITKSRGFILLSTPNWFSLDLHLAKSWPGRLAERGLAAARHLRDSIGSDICRHVEPDLTHGVYPDCDQLTAVIPRRLADAVRAMGCAVDFWDTTYMCAHRAGSATTLRFQKNTARPFLRNYGDHLLLLAHKS